MKWRQDADQTEAQIDLSPLIDVVFILLIFFMVTTTFAKDLQLELERPQASSSAPVDDSTLRVQIDASGKIYLDGEEVRPWVLTSQVSEKLKQKTQKNVLVVADRSTPAQNLVEVVDSCRLGGAEHVGVATDGKQKGT